MPIALLFVILAAGLAFLAYPGGAEAAPGERTPGERAQGERAQGGRAQGERTQALKRIESRSHQERIHILEQAESCLQAARTARDSRTCEESEARARQESNLRAREARLALRQGR